MRADTSLRTAGGEGSAGPGPGAAGSWPEATRAVLAGAGGRGGGGGWDVTVGGFWCTARPSGSSPLPAQGWKLHVSAASVVGGEVLAAVVRVLAADPCGFKFAAGEERLRELNSRNSDRGSAGKFITVYPADDAQFQRLAAELDRVTAGLPGPVVLSDRPYRPGSRVHYRYGAFAARAELGNDGEYRSVLRGPGGERAEDVRGGSYRAPGWARDPFAPAAVRPGRPGRRPGGVLLAGRYAVTAAIRHGAKGGVFLGREAASGAEVVVKQARAHIEVDRAGTDARDALRHEAELLARLDGQGLAPRAVELIEQEDSVFLVQERIAGQPLGAWVAARLRRDGSPDVDWAEAEPVARGLLDLVERVHGQGLVLRDLSPGNVMVRPDGGLRLVDLELAAEAGHRAGSAGTPGYQAPEQGRLSLAGSSVADPAVDLYALGGLFFLLATGHDPLLPEDLPRARPVAERLGRWLTLAARTGATARRLAPVVLGLRAEEPALRWGVARVRAELGGAERERAADRAVVTPLWHAANRAARPAPGGLPHDGPRLDGPALDGPALDGPALDRLLHDGLRHLSATATPGRPDRLWPVVPAGERTDPCNVQHGAAGVLAVLARAVAADGLPEDVRAQAAHTARTAADWIERRVAAEPVILPGLHFGRSGTAWALLDAARVLGDAGAAARAAALARRIAVEWPNPDVCHGAAGAGFTQLRFAAENLDNKDFDGTNLGGGDLGGGFLDRAAHGARALLAAARREPYGTTWPVPADFDSALAGITHLGFAHGVAGVGAFLLATAEATGDRTLLDGAADAARTLGATVRWNGADRRSAWWPQSAGDPEHIRLAHWCSGSSGTGGFLLRLWRATGDAAALDLARAAGRAVLAGRWHSGVSACHGLAGDGEYLLDLAEALDEPEFRTGAQELGRLIASRAALRDGLLVLPDETGIGCAAAYGTGTAGPLAFLLRLRHGGPRLWLDPVPPGTGRLPHHTTGVSEG
ncbi:class IV lanthionine synthetase LanL [Kitasatospora sp. SUK 42]|uniref:class IV lanthionine synthetase LanL n=1 Tax=Kitasatospora sp. SUK 42 TaxID=1588882 RepID=UPI001C31BB05|nr:class IV lanthionine synthetase LanL [Kitasatospora sp. SUK 42]MBV2153749.1 class IV lanthionine synthetase LanL [Kitasatospora sp. SUK 42]